MVGNEVYFIAFVRFEKDAEYYVNRLCETNGYDIIWILNLSAIIVVPMEDYYRLRYGVIERKFSLFTELQRIKPKR